jgi:hypothetical protein
LPFFGAGNPRRMLDLVRRHGALTVPFDVRVVLKIPSR